MRLRTPILAVVALALSGCGQGGMHAPDLGHVPLVAGARVVLELRSCDPGANADCAYQLVVANPRYSSSQDFLDAQRRRFRALGWSGAYAPNGDEHAVDSPDGRVHVTFATPQGDLTGIDFGWIKRRHAIALALVNAMFTHAPTLSLLVQLGSS